MKVRGKQRADVLLATIGCLLAVFLLPAAASADPQATASIVGGHAGTIEEFPSLVYIEAVDGKQLFSCTGSVVAPRVVLTAAHCVESVEKGTITPASGYALSTGVADPRQAGPDNIFRIAATHVFPGFDPGVLHGDAAILILDRPTSAPPISMAGAADAGLYAGGAEAQLAGWGLTRAGSKAGPANLQMTTVSIKPPSFCKQKTGRFYKPFLAAAQTCVISADGRSGGCFGDSGGPAIAHRADGSAVEVGITSTGGPDCTTKVPTVLTRVDLISPWVSEWIAATEAGAPPPADDLAAPLPPMLRESAEEFTVFTLLEAMGKRFKATREVFGGCKRVSGSRFRCQLSWAFGRDVFLGTVSPFYVHREGTVSWDSHYRVEWAALKCLEDQQRNRRCQIHKKRG